MIIDVVHCVGAPEDHPQAQWFVRGTQRTQHVVIILMALIYYSERTLSKSSEGRHKWGEVWRKPGMDFQKSFLREVTKDMFYSSSDELWQHK